MEHKTQLLVVGAGAAGLTAALYARRAGMDVIVLGRAPYGGQIAETAMIENYPALPLTDGYTFASALYQQAASLGAKLISAEVTGVLALSAQQRTLQTADGSKYTGEKLVLAVGAKRRKLGCPGEERLLGSGVSYCASCDGAFFRGKTVAVVGGGNTALEDALTLSALCERVYLIHRRDAFRGEKYLEEAVHKKQNIQPILQEEVAEIEGAQHVEAVRLKNRKEALAVDGVFVAVGQEPDTALFRAFVNCDEGGYFIAGEDCKTNLPGVFAAGDCRTKLLRQIVTAAADGAVAAFSASQEVQSGM